MRYQQSIAIHDRIEEVLRLIGTGEYSTPALAEAMGVSIPTVSRIVAALREQGHDIQAERTHKGWRYVLPRPTHSVGKEAVNGGYGHKRRNAQG